MIALDEGQLVLFVQILVLVSGEFEKVGPLNGTLRFDFEKALSQILIEIKTPVTPEPYGATSLISVVVPQVLQEF